MAGAAGRGSNVGERRKQRALEAFRNELADLDAEEIQARLDAHRIRSAERRTIARQRLRMLRSEETAEAPGADEPRTETRNEPEGQPGTGGEPRGDDIKGAEPQRAARTAADDGGSRKTHSQEKQTGNGQDQPADTAVNDAAGEDVATEQDETHALPLARQIGRFVGMTAAVGGVVLAGAWLIRR